MVITMAKLLMAHASCLGQYMPVVIFEPLVLLFMFINNSRTKRIYFIIFRDLQGHPETSKDLQEPSKTFSSYYELSVSRRGP